MCAATPSTPNNLFAAISQNLQQSCRVYENPKNTQKKRKKEERIFFSVLLILLLYSSEETACNKIKDRRRDG
jgi:hypothetical protein